MSTEATGNADVVESPAAQPDDKGSVTLDQAAVEAAGEAAVEPALEAAVEAAVPTAEGSTAIPAEAPVPLAAGALLPLAPELPILFAPEAPAVPAPEVPVAVTAEVSAIHVLAEAEEEASGDDRTVITFAPPPESSPATESPLLDRTPAPSVLSDTTQPGAELEVLESIAADTIPTSELALRAGLGAEPSRPAPVSRLLPWSGARETRRRPTLELVKRLATKRHELSGLQIAVAVLGAALAGGLVSRATAGAGSDRRQFAADTAVHPESTPPSGPIVVAVPATVPTVAEDAPERPSKAPRRAGETTRRK